MIYWVVMLFRIFIYFKYWPFRINSNWEIEPKLVQCFTNCKSKKHVRSQCYRNMYWNWLQKCMRGFVLCADSWRKIFKNIRAIANQIPRNWYSTRESQGIFILKLYPEILEYWGLSFLFIIHYVSKCIGPASITQTLQDNQHFQELVPNIFTQHDWLHMCQSLCPVRQRGTNENTKKNCRGIWSK